MTSATETVRAAGRGSLIGARMREAGWGYAFVLVPMAVFGLFFIYPLVYGIYISFFEWGILGKAAGSTASLENYQTLYHDQVFHRAMRNTFEYAFLVVPLEMALGLLLALVINARLRGRAFFRSAFYVPSIVSSVAITTIAIFILNPDGLLNKIIGSDQAWFGDADTALYSVVGLNAWTTAGTVMLFYLAALQSIPPSLAEAAAIEGAPRSYYLRRIVLPLLMPTTLFVLVNATINSFKLVDHLFILTKGGPDNASNLLLYYIYQVAFSFFDTAYAAALTAVLLALLAALAAVQFLLIDKRVHYR